MNVRSGFAIALIIVLSLLMVACSTSQIITDVEIVSTAISVGAPIVAAFGGPGASTISAYLTVAAQGSQCLLTAAQASGATSISIAAAAASCFGAAVVPALPPGTPATVIAIVEAVSAGIANLVNKYGARPGLHSAAEAVPVKLKFQDKRRIRKMEKELQHSLLILKK